MSWADSWMAGREDICNSGNILKQGLLDTTLSTCTMIFAALRRQMVPNLFQGRIHILIDWSSHHEGCGRGSVGTCRCVR